MNKEQSIIKKIALHTLVWLCLYGFILYQTYSITRTVNIFSGLSAKFIFNITLFYLNFYVLVPNYLLKKRLLNYILISVVVLLSASYLIDTFITENLPFINAMPYSQPMSTLDPPNMDAPSYPLGGTEVVTLKIYMLIGSTINLMFYFIIGAIIRMYIEWNKNELLREKTEHERVHSELQFLKAQLNPHFLFNSLNAVYTLAIKKSSDTAEVILNLAELMRYMIYEADRDTVSLEKELNYIQNYVQLQRLRLSNHEYVAINISGNPNGKIIRPLLFISFIENAFKYGTNYKGITEVKINITINDNNVYFFIRNRIGVIKKSLNNSGIGLRNIQNRLKLLYPDRHELKIENDKEYYSISLTIYLTENEMYNN